MDAEKAAFGIARMARLLEVSGSSYYDLGGTESGRADPGAPAPRAAGREDQGVP